MYPIAQEVLSKFFHGTASRVMVEVGAGQPGYMSLGAVFRDRAGEGWRVISIEPNPVFAEMFRKDSLEIEQCACGSYDYDSFDFCVVDLTKAKYIGDQVSFESYSALRVDPDYERMLQVSVDGAVKHQLKVRLRKLDSILEEKEIAAVDVLAIDVEGWELDVLRGFSIEKYKPRIVIVENLFERESYREFFRAQGYALWQRFAQDEVYLRM